MAEFTLVQMGAAILSSSALSSVVVALIGAMPNARQARIARQRLDLDRQRFGWEERESLVKQLQSSRKEADDWEAKYREIERTLLLRLAHCEARGNRCDPPSPVYPETADAPPGSIPLRTANLDSPSPTPRKPPSSGGGT